MPKTSIHILRKKNFIKILTIYTNNKRAIQVMCIHFFGTPSISTWESLSRLCKLRTWCCSTFWEANQLLNNKGFPSCQWVDLGIRLPIHGDYADRTVRHVLTRKSRPLNTLLFTQCGDLLQKLQCSFNSVASAQKCSVNVLKSRKNFANSGGTAF